MSEKPTMQDVAERAGVSRSLVSLVFQNATNVSPARRKAVLQAADELGYRPNRVARNLAQGRSMMIGVVVDDFQNPFFTRTIEGIEQRASVSGYQVLLANGALDVERSLQAASTFADLQVDALILVGLRGPIEPLIEQARRIPTALVAQPATTDAMDTVQTDEYIGSHLAVEHLAQAGHTSIVHVDGGSGASAAIRRAGYERAMQQHGLQADIISSDFTPEGGRKAALALSERPTLPSAVFAANDMIAAGLSTQLHRHNIDIPGDLSLVGYDDSTLPGLGNEGLTTVRQPSLQIGDRAAELVVERISAGRTEAVHELVAPTLIVRASTRPVS